MCTVCGCGEGEVRIESDAHSHAHEHTHADGTTHSHPHDHRHGHDHGSHGGHLHTHTHADGTSHSHAHDHSHSHSHSEAHDHQHDPDHDHAHVHTHADGTTHHHAHSHGHDHAHARDHGHDHGDSHEHGQTHTHADGTTHTHGPESTPSQSGDHLHYGAGLAGVHVAGLTQARIVQIERDILAKNDDHARRNRARLAQAGIFALNFVSSPGAGKTSLLVRAIRDLASRYAVAVIEGDQQTSHDAERIRATGAPAIQINTGKGCHLDAQMVGQALDRLPLDQRGLLFIENVGNLVCPAAFDLGEAHKVVVFSVTEGEDKPIKYPDMFAAADLMLINKIDLVPHLDFDLAQTIEYARRVNPRIAVLTVSARSGEGMAAFYAWIDRQVGAARAAAE